MTDLPRGDRRSFLTGALVGAASGMTAAAYAGALRRAARPEPGEDGRSRARVEWRLASSFPASLDTIFGAASVLADRVRALSEGGFSIQVFQAGELVPPLQVLDGVQGGACEVGQTAGYYYTGKQPALAFDTCVPFGLTPRQQNAWLFEGGGLELVRRLYADFGVLSFPCGNTGAQMGGWFRRPIGSLEELRGLRMRIPGLGGRVMDRLGVTVQQIPGGEVSMALERGTIDAAEWVGPYDDEQLGLHQAARHYLYPGWWEPGPSLSFLVNRAAWDALPATYREIFAAASQEAASAMQTRYDAKNPAALERLLAAGVDLQRFPDEILRAAREATEELLTAEAAADPTYRELLDHWRAFRAASFRWFRTAELAYAQFAFEG